MVLTDEHIITREELFTRLYKDVFPSVARFIRKKGGSLEDTKDVFQEALVIYYEKVMDHSEIEQDQAYLFGIARHLWYQKQKQRQGRESLLDEPDMNLVDEGKDSHPSEQKLVDLLAYAGEKCMEILRAFYYDKLSMSKLSERFGFRSERSATVQKYKCLEKVRDQVKIKKMEYEDFFE